MLGRLSKLVIVIVAAGAIWWWVGAREEAVPTVEIEEVGYEEVVGLLTDGAVQDEEAQDDDVEDLEASEPQEEDVSEVPDTEPIQVDTDVTESADAETSEDSDIPGAYNLAVPFTSQAPHANWDLPYQEACEEASVLMVARYFDGESGVIDPDDADAALLRLVEFQLDMFGDYLDTTAEETRQMLDGYFNLQAYVVESPSVAQIKSEIAAGRPVIVPAAGQQLGNPFFSGAGPLYHMLVIKGYTDDQFITNDPGTKRGNNYAYDIDVIMSAMGDWNDGDPANGAKRVIFVAP